METETEKVRLERIRYHTMNSWNLSKAPAYNLKVWDVIPNDLTDKVFDMMECEDFYDDINIMIHNFGEKHDFEWQAGFNGRSGGYLVLYKGGVKNKQIVCYPGKDIEDDEVPDDIMEDFDRLAHDIVESVIYKAKSCIIKEVKYIVEKTKKVISYD